VGVLEYKEEEWRKERREGGGEGWKWGMERGGGGGTEEGRIISLISIKLLIFIIRYYGRQI
jgi:hypothetical protein